MLKEGVTLSYDKGTILIRGLAHIPFATLDPRSNVLRAQGLYYQNIVDYLKQSRIGFADYVFSDIIASPDFQTIGNNYNRNGRSRSTDGDNDDDNNIPRTITTTTNEYKEGAALHSPQVSPPNHPPPLTSSSSSIVSLRDYQHKALANWIRAGMKGSVVLPTGAGKTLVGVSAIKRVNASALIVVPTIDLMDQWTGILAKHLPSTKIGNLGGGSEDIQPITVSTYDSAYLRAPLLGNKFLLIIFDEVHHLAAPGYRTIAEQMAAPYRLGLTATIEREDELHKDLPRLVGDVVYRASIDSLAKKKHLAPYEVERRKVELLPEELKEYQQNMHTYRQCLHDIGRKAAVIRGNNNDDGRGRHDAYYYNISLEKLIMISGKNPIARQALLARNRAINIALNSKAKIEELKEILVENPGKKTIIFTQHNSMVYQISDKFLIPFITYKTNKEERQEVLRGFKEGRYMAIVTSKVLDEGVDVPDAELGIIVSGTGSGREFIQRLGRLLRPKEQIKTAASASSVATQATTLPSSSGTTTASNTNTTIKRAKLIEIISSETREESITSVKRKRALRSIRAPQQQEEVEDKEGQREVGRSLSC